MKCPSCGYSNIAEAAFCGLCYAVLQRKPAVVPVPVPAAPPSPRAAEPVEDIWGLDLLKPSAAVAAAPALLLALFFASYLPITPAWMSFKQLFVLGMVNLAFHEAGHVLLGFFGQWIGVLGGSLFQLVWPGACLVHFYRQRSVSGVVFCVFWLGHNLVDISFYLADAKGGNLVLLTGYTGSEGSFHDWRFLLDSVGLRAWAVGLGRLVFFAGLWLVGLAGAWGGALLWRHLRKSQA